MSIVYGKFVCVEMSGFVYKLFVIGHSPDRKKLIAIFAFI